MFVQVGRLLLLIIINFSNIKETKRLQNKKLYNYFHFHANTKFICCEIDLTDVRRFTWLKKFVNFIKYRDDDMYVYDKII